MHDKDFIPDDLMVKNYNVNFSIVPNEICRTNKISPNAKALYLYLISLNPCVPKIQTIINAIGLKERSLYRAKAELVNAGLLYTQKNKNNANIYKITDRITRQDNAVVPANLAVNNAVVPANLAVNNAVVPANLAASTCHIGRSISFIETKLNKKNDVDGFGDFFNKINNADAPECDKEWLCLALKNIANSRLVYWLKEYGPNYVLNCFLKASTKLSIQNPTPTPEIAYRLNSWLEKQIAIDLRDGNNLPPKYAEQHIGQHIGDVPEDFIAHVGNNYYQEIKNNPKKLKDELDSFKFYSSF